MNAEAVLEWLWAQLAPNLPVEKQDLFRQILRLTWYNQSYAEMSDHLNYADSYIQKKLARELWKIATHTLGEPVSKKTIRFKTTEQYRALHGSHQAQSPFEDRQETDVQQLPFGDVGKITVPSRFFDRQSILSEMFHHLSQGGSVSLVGEREIGKSSILLQLCRCGPKDLLLPPERFIYIDMQLIHDEQMFFRELCKALSIEISRGYALLEQLQSQRYILCIDEVEKLTGSQFSSNLRDELRGIADGWDMPFCLVLASTTSLVELFPDASCQTSPLANLCYPMQVPRFSPELCRQFLGDRLQNSPIQFSLEQMETLIQSSQGHPARLQALAKALYLELKFKHKS